MAAGCTPAMVTYCGMELLVVTKFFPTVEMIQSMAMLEMTGYAAVTEMTLFKVEKVAT